MADRRGHASDLPIAAFGERELDPRRGNGLAMTYGRHTRPQPRRLADSHGRRRSARDSVKRNRTVGERREGPIVGFSFYLGDVGALVSVAWVSEAVLQCREPRP